MAEEAPALTRLAWWIEALLVRAALAALRALGPVAASNVGGTLARLVGPLLPVSRVAEVNLRLALPELDRTARRRVIRGAWENLGRTVGELPHLARIVAARDAPAGPGWELVGGEMVEALGRRGGPAIFFSGHIGNWEMLPPVVAACGIRMAFAYRAAANPRVDRILAELRREATGAEVPMFPKGAQGARAALAHLARGGFLSLLMDQKLNDGIEVPFFGRPAMTAPALAALALRFRCPVIPGHAQRIGPARFRIVCEAPLPLPDSGDRQADIAALTREVNACLERWIRAWPEGWLWLHRRWPKPLYQRGAA